MTILSWWIGIGVLNYWWFLSQGKASILFSGHKLEGVVEALFFILAWPLQLLFKIFVGINIATDWVLGKLMG